MEVDRPDSVEVVEFKEVNKDGRRRIDEAPFNDCSVQFFQIGPKRDPLGNHYHGHKDEVFVLTYGRGVFRSAPVNERGEICGPIRTEQISAGWCMKVPRNNTHRFDLEEGSCMFCFSSSPYKHGGDISCPISDDDSPSK